MQAYVFPSKPAVVVWFQVLNLPGGIWHDDKFQLVRGTRPYQAHIGYSVGQPSGGLIGVQFPDDCRNEPRLHIRYLHGAGTVDFDIANPLTHDAVR